MNPTNDLFQAAKAYFSDNGFGYVGGSMHVHAYTHQSHNWLVNVRKDGRLHIWNTAVSVGVGKVWFKDLPLEDYEQAIRLLEAAADEAGRTEIHDRRN